MSGEATETLMSGTPASSTGRYRDGWVDRLVLLPHRLPGPAWIWLGVLLLAIALLATVLFWLAGVTAIGNVEWNVVPPAVIIVYFLGLTGVMAQVGRSAFDEFRPALGADSNDHDRLCWELTRIPDRQAMLAIGIAILISIVGLAASGSVGTVSDLPPLAIATVWTLWWTAIATTGVAVFYTLRQLRWVSRLYAVATNVDVFDTGPINAFSRLTATSAAGILIVALLLIFGTDETAAPDQDTASFLLGPGPLLIPVAVASFVSPLRGMHRRLVADKNRLLGKSAERMKETLALIHETVDSRDFTLADQLQKTLSSLLAERQVLASLPTWPWSPGTLRGFATAAVLPIVLWLVIRLLDRLVG